mgnify:CR=1 FL=1|jgi:DNA replication protein DnaC
MILSVDVDDWFRDALSEALAKCTICKHTGNVVTRDESDPLEYVVAPCVCKAKVQKKARLIASNIPSEFWKSETAGLEWNKGHYERVKTYASKLGENRSSGSGLLMVGENGVGKTFSACHILTQALSNQFTAGYLTMHEFMTYKKTWNDVRLKDWLDLLLFCDFLVIDEVGKEYKAKGSDWVHAEFDTLLRKRRGYNLPTIIISNLTVIQFKERYGASLWSILRDRMDVLQYAPGDFREVLGKRRKK